MQKVTAKHNLSRNGYTLIEMLVATVSASILIAGMGSSIFITTRAFDETNSQPSQVLEASRVAEHIMYEMQYATRFYEQSPNAVTFAVPDRDGDGGEEVFRYAWSGVIGAPLTKERNGSSPAVLVPSVQNLNFQFMTRMLIAPPPPVLPEVVFEEFTEQKEPSGVDSITVATPDGTNEGDLLIAAVGYDGEEGFNPATGWTLIHAAEDNDGKVSFAVWWRLASFAEPSSHTFSWADTDHAYGFIMRFTGHDGATPIHAISTGDGKSSSPTSPAVTTAVDNCMILRIGGFDQGDVTVDDAGLADHTTITMDESSSSNAGTSGGAGYAVLDTAGDAGTADFALTGSEEYVTVTVAIAPAD